MEHEAPFVLRLDDVEADLRVLSWDGVELISGLYEHDVVVSSDVVDGSVEERALGGQATLEVGERAWRGVIARATWDGQLEGSVPRCRIRLLLVPRMWHLGLRHRSRIFQRRTVVEIVTEVLGQAGIVAHPLLTQTYPRRDYCTQYEETDLAFVDRLLAENGIFYLLLRPPVGPEMVALMDDASVYPPHGTDFVGLLERAATAAAAQLAGAVADQVVAGAGTVASELVARLSAEIGGEGPTLPYHPKAQALSHAHEEAITAFTREHQLRPTRGEHRGFDPRRPLAPLTSRAAGQDDLVGSAVAMGEQQLAQHAPQVTAGLQTAASMAGLDVDEHYEHHLHATLPSWEHLKQEATRIIGAQRRDAIIGRGQSSNPQLQPGHRFRLEGHPAAASNRGYVPVEIRHRGRATVEGDVEVRYENYFVAVPDEVAYLPPRPPRRHIQSMETALVVAPADEEIFTAEMAMVRVHFHWDREQARDENTSCWIRVAQSWAGAGQGAQFIPRVGSEVLVGFEGGDPDRPFVLGSLYNAINPAPFSLPEERTVSGFRTRTVPRGEVGNELSFDDAGGREVLRLHASRDLLMEVRHDRRAEVVHDDRVVVHGARYLEVRGERHVDVRGTDQRRSTTAADTVAGQSSLDVEGARIERFGSLRRTVTGDSVVSHTGHATTLVGSEDGPRSYNVVAEGDARIAARRQIRLEADEEVILRCGGSQVRLHPEGIELMAPSVTIQGSGARLLLADGDAHLAADGHARVVADQAVVKSAQASLGLSSEASLAGSRVLLNSPEQASDAIEEPSETPTMIHLCDDDGEPMAYQPFRIALDDGTEMAGMLDADGRATVMLPGTGTIYFPDAGDVEEG